MKDTENNAPPPMPILQEHNAIAQVAERLNQPVTLCPGDSLVGIQNVDQLKALQKAVRILRLLGTVRLVNGTDGAEPVLDGNGTKRLFAEIFDIAAGDLK